MRIGDQAVQGEGRPDPWKDRQKSIKGDTGGKRQNPVFADIAPHPKKDVAPSAAGDG